MKYNTEWKLQYYGDNDDGYNNTACHSKLMYMEDSNSNNAQQQPLQ